MKDKRYSNYLKNKRVAIIGPAHYTTTKKFKGQGKEIDNYDIVVRINRGMELISEYKDNLGTRTDVFYNCLIEHPDNGGKIDIDHLKKTNIKWISTIPNSDMSGICHDNTLHPMVNQNTVKLIKQDFNFHVMDFKPYGELNKHTKCRTNTGFAAVFDLLYHDVKCLFITGFSFYLDAFAPGYKAGCGRNEEEFARQCFISKRHNQVNQWNYARENLKNNPKVILDDVLTKILNLKTLCRDEFAL